MHRTRAVGTIWYCLLLIGLLGCGSNGPACAPVAGKVTFNGAPVTTGTITFYPAQGRSAMGKIAPDGTYSLTTLNAGDGAIVGTHTVTIEATDVSGPAPPASFEEEKRLNHNPQPLGTPTVRWLVPAAFADRATSKLTAEVVAGQNQIDFSLPVAK